MSLMCGPVYILGKRGTVLSAQASSGGEVSVDRLELGGGLPQQWTGGVGAAVDVGRTIITFVQTD